MTRFKLPYEAPRILDLGGEAMAQPGATDDVTKCQIGGSPSGNCTAGANAGGTKCQPGGNVGGECLSGSSASGTKCQQGSVAGGQCLSGSVASARCRAGGYPS